MWRIISRSHVGDVGLGLIPQQRDNQPFRWLAVSWHSSRGCIFAANQPMDQSTSRPIAIKASHFLTQEDFILDDLYISTEYVSKFHPTSYTQFPGWWCKHIPHNWIVTAGKMEQSKPPESQAMDVHTRHSRFIYWRTMASNYGFWLVQTHPHCNQPPFLLVIRF